MILFEQDWALYPSAFPDLQTKNKSFVRLASIYRSMGVRNHAFILALLNPNLVGVDPFDPDLTLDMQAAVVIECKMNPWYFFREVARAPGLAGSPPSMLEANRGNISLFWCFFNHIMIFLIQIRQTGKSFNTDVLMTLLMNVICENTSINLLTKDDTLRRANIERLKNIASELPRYMQQKSRMDANNGEELTIRSLGNTYTTHVPQSSPKNAYKMGRGLTSPIFHIDEPPFQPNIAIALPAALSATGAAVDRAREAGTPWGTIFTTTSGKKDDKDGKYVYNLLQDSAMWTEAFFDAANAHELELMICRNSRAGVCRINATFNHRQLGKTDDWLRTKLRESLSTGDDANRDYFNMWTSGSQTNPLSVQILEAITRSFMPAVYSEISKPHGYIMRWYISDEEIEHRMANGQFILGSDTSEAVGNDDISLVLTDVETLETVAAGNYNETNLITLADWICKFLVKYKNVTMIVERRSTGGMLLDYLLLMLPQYGEDPFKRLYNRVVHDFDEDRGRYQEICQSLDRRDPAVYVRFKKTFGFATSSGGVASRSELYSTTLQNAAKRGCGVVRDKMLIDQIAGLINRNGRIDHDDGEHDDMVIGWLLCNWLLFHGKNLAHYGINNSRVMSLVNTAKKEESPLEMQRRFEQQKIRERIIAIYEELTAERDDNVCIKLEHELRLLDRKVILEEGEHYSVDDLLRQVNENRKNKRRNFESRYRNTSSDDSILSGNDRALYRYDNKATYDPYTGANVQYHIS